MIFSCSYCCGPAPEAAILDSRSGANKKGQKQRRTLLLQQLSWQCRGLQGPTGEQRRGRHVPGSGDGTSLFLLISWTWCPQHVCKWYMLIYLKLPFMLKMRRINCSKKLPRCSGFYIQPPKMPNFQNITLSLYQFLFKKGQWLLVSQSLSDFF